MSYFISLISISLHSFWPSLRFGRIVLFCFEQKMRPAFNVFNNAEIEGHFHIALFGMNWVGYECRQCNMEL